MPISSSAYTSTGQNPFHANGAATANVSAPTLPINTIAVR